jgi:Histidine kinase-, DNA gyrase B-, and HSP90-like ATPase.
MTHGLAVGGGVIIIETIEQDGMISVEVRDDGPSRTASAESTTAGTSGRGSGLGLHIIRTLVQDDLQGEFSLVIGEEWTVARVRFPRHESDTQ